MNKVLLIGRLTTKPELTYTSGNTPFTRFSVAVSRNFKNADGTYDTDFIPVQVWRRQAENVTNFLEKGDLICIEGTIHTETYTDKNGNKKSAWTIVASNVEFLQQKKKINETTETNPFEDFAETIEEDTFLD